MEENSERLSGTWRLLVLGIVAVLLIVGLVFVVLIVSGSADTAQSEAEPVNALANSDDECVVCHRRTTAGIVEQYGHSTMAAAEVTCRDCHEVTADYAGAVEHEDTYVLGSPSTAMCEQCHTAEVAQFNQSRHALPAYVAYAGTEPLTETQLTQYQGIPEGGAPGGDKAKARNSLHALEGEAVTRFACEVCHNVGKPHPDGSVGQCQKCHLRHEFSLEQARKPETCNQCHIGPDHPQWEIYQESPHGIAYATGGDRWNWEAEVGTLTVNDFPAATCALCHMSGFGGTGTTHDVGERLTWYLFAPISERRPSWQDNQVEMQSVCQACHNSNWIDSFYTDADAATEAVNDWVRESDEIVAPLQEAGLMTPAPFDQEIDFVYFELWHHWGRTAKFGAWMQGPDYTQWHGAYELLADLAELREMSESLLGGDE
ncbi:MAG: multiheme c-type cytochrome [Candidatus Promineifilaceae bacterium]|nr:multiheme c-type cytochrome [Candidatus Promineifilaceae bacterium]